jgi:hypothetical protein
MNDDGAGIDGRRTSVIAGKVMGAMVLAAMVLAAVVTAAAGARAGEVAAYPDMRAQWTRADSAQFDPSKRGGRAQQAPLTPEYQARLEKIIADRAVGSLEGNATATCLPTGMPRAMIVYETMDIIIRPDMTFVRMSLMNELRRIHTDGRAWPDKLAPSFIGTSIGRWLDEDGDGRYDVLAIETRGFKGPRTFDGTPGIPLHDDNQTVVQERLYLDKANPDLLRADITVIDHALTRPWTVARKYKRERNPFWADYHCGEGNQQVVLGKENYMISADGYLMPVRKDQPPPDLRYFDQPK